MKQFQTTKKLTMIAGLVALVATGFTGSASADGCQGDAIGDGSYNVCLAYVQSAGGSGSCTWSSNYNNPVSADLDQAGNYAGAGLYQSEYSTDCGGSFTRTRTQLYTYSPAGFVSVEQYDCEFQSSSETGGCGGTTFFMNSEFVAVVASQQHNEYNGWSHEATGALFYTPIAIFFVGEESYNGGQCTVYVGSPVAPCPAEAPELPRAPPFPVLP